MNTVTPEPCLLLSYLHSVLLWLVGLGMYDLFYIRGIYRYMCLFITTKEFCDQ